MTRLQNLRAIAGRQIGQFMFDETGATAIEYAMIAGGVGVVVAGAVMNLGSSLKTTFYEKLASLFP